MTKPVARFEIDDLNEHDTPEVLKDLILDLMLSWPKLEYGLTIWIAFVQGVPVSEVAAALGTMSNRDKLKRLKALYAHRDDQEAIDLLRAITKEHEVFARVRKTIAHAMLIGTSKSQQDDAYFLTTRAMPGEQGFMEVRQLAFSNFEEARHFAIERALDVRALLKARGAAVD